MTNLIETQNSKFKIRNKFKIQNLKSETTDRDIWILTSGFVLLSVVSFEVFEF